MSYRAAALPSPPTSSSFCKPNPSAHHPSLRPRPISARTIYAPGTDEPKRRPRRNEPEHQPEECTSEPADPDRPTAPAARAASPRPRPARFDRWWPASPPAARPTFLLALAAAISATPRRPARPAPPQRPSTSNPATPRSPNPDRHSAPTHRHPDCPRDPEPQPPPPASPSALAPLGLPARRGTSSTIRRSTRRSLPPRQRRP